WCGSAQQSAQQRKSQSQLDAKLTNSQLQLDAIQRGVNDVLAKLGPNSTPTQVEVLKGEIAHIVNAGATITAKAGVAANVVASPTKPKAEWLSVFLVVYGAVFFIWYCVFCLAGVTWRPVFWLRVVHRD